MTTPISDYGTKLEYCTSGSGGSYTDFATLINIEVPEIINEPIEITNHESLAREFVSGGLKEIAPFKFKITLSSALITTVKGWVAGTALVWFKITFPTTNTWVFNAAVTHFKANDPDAQSPDVVQAEISLRPSGAITIA